MRVKQLIENQFSLTMIVFLLLGLVLPGIEFLPPVIIMVLVSGAIYVACFKIDFKEIRKVSLLSCTKYYVARFVIFPVLVFHIAQIIVPQYAVGAFLLAAMPCGASSPSICAMLGGNTTMALGLVSFSSLLCPYMISFLFVFLSGQEVVVDHYQIMMSLGLAIFIPIVMYLPVRNVKPLKKLMADNNSFFSTLLLGLMLMVIVGQKKAELLAQISDCLRPLLILIVMYFLFYALPWFFMNGSAHRERLSFTLCSGLNNNGLAIALVAMYFTDLIIFMVLSEILWFSGLVVFKKYLEKNLVAKQVTD